MNDGELLRAATLAAPGDDTIRFVYADCLQENGRAHEAACLRAMRREKYARLVRSGEYSRALCGGRPTIPDVIREFAMYYRNHAEWGSLHIVLSDGNEDDESVRFCLSRATANADSDGARLAEILLTMTRTQRGRIPNVCRYLCDLDNRGEWHPRFGDEAEIICRCIRYRYYMGELTRMRKAKK